MAQRPVETVVGVLPDRAGVDEDHIRVVERFGADHAVELEQPGDSLRVVLVHLAAKSADQIALPGPRRLATRWVAPGRRRESGRGHRSASEIGGAEVAGNRHLERARETEIRLK